jgi:hypothetical protein
MNSTEDIFKKAMRSISATLNFDIREQAISIDEKSVQDLEGVIQELLKLRMQVEEIRIQSGGILPSDGLLVIGSVAFDLREPGTQCTIHRIEDLRLRRKGE